jgi:CHAT domain-containing protein
MHHVLRIDRQKLRKVLVACLLLAASGARAAEAGSDAAARAAELSSSGRFEEAALAWRELAQGLGAEGKRAGQVSALVRAADAQQALGRYADSLQTLAEAQALAGESAGAAQLASIHGAIGNAYVALGPPERAREHLGKALELARTAEDQPLAAALLTNLGNLDASKEAYAEAARAYAEAAELAEKSSDPTLAARALANQAQALQRAGAAAGEVHTALARATLKAEALPDSHAKASVLISAGRTHARLGELERAHALLRRADAVSGAIGDARAQSYAQGYLGALYEEQGRLDEALALSRRALFLAQQANAPESLYRWHWQVGRLLAAKGAADEAISSYRQAVLVLSGIRFDMAHGYAASGGSFRDAVGPVFFELVDLLLATAPDAADAGYQARLRDARDMLEKLKAAELRDYFRDECVDAIQAKVEDLDEVARAEVVIYPVVLPDRLELLLTFPSGMRRATVPVRAEALTTEVHRLRALLEKRTTQQYLPHAKQLYDWLLRPFAADLAKLGTDTLVFVPDGPLRTIPMSALHDGEHFLVERYAVVTTPGLSLTDPRPLNRQNLRVFASGLGSAVQGFPPLPHVPAELDSIHALYGGELLLDEQFNTPRIEAELDEREFSVVHVATHGEFAEDSEHSFLLTWDGRLDMDRLGEAVGRTRFRDRPIELLTLSACETAQGSERAALGLAGVAIQAGARSALGTLWSVNDAAAAELVREFYGELHDPKNSKAVALQRAQQKILRDASHAHPYYWAPFLLIGNWL